MVYECVMGIDPGRTGGIAVVTKDNLIPYTYKMPESVQEFRTVLDNYKDYKVVVFLEKVNMWIGDMTTKQEATESEKKAMRGKVFRLQKLIANYNEIKTCIKWQGYDLIECTPGQWQKGLSLRPIKDKTDRKNRNKDHARYFYSGIKITHQNADALLIMQYGLSRLSGGIYKPEKKELPKQGELF